MEKQTIIAIIAHPDDEAFGPSGTIAKYAQQGHNMYLLCATKGEAGENRKKQDSRNLQEIREEELQNSAKILGVKKVFFLGFEDGTLSNNLYHKVADKIIETIKPINPNILITIEPRGVSGHLDHIAISMISSYVFEKVNSIKTIMYFCITEQMRKFIPNYFIYFPPGYKESEINHIEDVKMVWKQKIDAIKSHKSQLKDTNNMLIMLNLFPKKEHFLIKKKKLLGIL